MPKLLFTTSTFNLGNFSERKSFESVGFEFIVNPYGKRLTEQQVDELLDEEVVGMVAGLEPLTESVINNAKALKVISRCGIGLDNVDIQTAEKKNISVFNTPDAPTKAVAELSIAHILSLCRRIGECDRALRQNKWQPLMGALISKQTVGIIGYGRIGKLVSNILLAMGARVLVYDTMPITTESNIHAVSLDRLLTESDIVSLHIPYSPETCHLINADTISLMKPTALLINVARGGLVDEVALHSALEANHLGGAALDCFEDEPYSGPLLQCDRVQMTAHMGSYAKEARAMMETEACNSLITGLKQHGLF